MRAKPLTQHLTSNVCVLMQFSTLLIFYLMAVCSYYFCLPLVFCDEKPAVKIQTNSFYFTLSCCCSICQNSCRKKKTVAEQTNENIALPFVILILTEFPSSLSQTVKKTALIFHIPTIIFPLLQGSRKSEPPTTFCTKATPLSCTHNTVIFQWL